MTKSKLNTRLHELYAGLQERLAPAATALVACQQEVTEPLLMFLDDVAGPYADLLTACETCDLAVTGSVADDDNLGASRRLLADLALAVHVDDMQYATRLARSLAATADLVSGDEAYAQGALNEQFEEYLHATSVHAGTEVDAD